MTVRVDIAVRFADQAQSVQHLTLFGNHRLFDNNGNQTIPALASGPSPCFLAIACN
jgi:hypothetical protein